MPGNIKILFFGDIVGKIGRKAVIKVLSELKDKYKPDLVLANVENLAHGQGITKKSLDEIKEAGVDFFTSGNHIWKKKEGYEILENKETIVLRPANYPPGTLGFGWKIIEIGIKKILIINLMGRVFFRETIDCPFRKIDEILQEPEIIQQNPLVILIDFHAEATSEKIAFGWHADGRAAAVLGTHTHVATADHHILPQGTGYVTDVGMVGAYESVIGINKENIIKNFLTQINQPHEIPEEGRVIVNAILLEIDYRENKTKSIKRLDQIIEI